MLSVFKINQKIKINVKFAKEYGVNCFYLLSRNIRYLFPGFPISYRILVFLSLVFVSVCTIIACQ